MQLKNKNLIIGSLIVLIIVGAFYFSNKTKSVPMATLENFDLPAYGERNDVTAKYLILVPFKAIINPENHILSSYQNVGYGLLGTSLLKNDSVKTAYASLFLGGNLSVDLNSVSSKLESSFLKQDNIWLITTDMSLTPTDSIIQKREATIYGVAFGLTDRYTYRKTNHELVSNSETYHITESGKQLKKLLVQGIEVFDEMKSKGYEDLTLKYALGILYASLKNDGVNLETINEYKLGTPQIYTDALKATLSKYRLEPVLEEGTFLKVLTRELSDRNINMLDLVFFKKNASADTASLTDDTPALIKIIESDLDKIAR